MKLPAHADSGVARSVDVVDKMKLTAHAGGGVARTVDVVGKMALCGRRCREELPSAFLHEASPE